MKRLFKYFALLMVLSVMFEALAVTVSAVEPDPVDMSLIFSPETQLVVYVDGAWSGELSGSYGYSESVSLTASATAGDKTFSHWEVNGSVVSYINPLKLTMNANTTLFAVYADATTEVKPVAGFTSITRSTDGEQIVLQAIASGETAGIVYSTTANTADALKIGGDGVTVVPAEKLSDTMTQIPQSALDRNNCYAMKIRPESDDTVYHVRTYVTEGGETTYGDVKDVKLSELPDGVSLIANLEGFEPGISEELSELTEGMHTVTFEANGGVGATIIQGFLGDSVTLRANTFTREGYTFDGWSTTPTGSVTYANSASVTLSANTTLYAVWKAPDSADNTPGYSGVGGGTTTYTAEVKDAEHGKITVDPKSAAEGAKVTVTVKPDEGYEVDAVTVKDADGKDVPATKNADGTYSYTQPKGKVTVTATFKEKTSAKDSLTVEELLKMFTDLDPQGWYLDDVRYCVENGMMNGVADDKFAPNGTTTRAMIVTILYRLEGEPVIRSGMPFSDVTESDWYAKAVSWAESQGIVTGYGDGRFGPNDPITREQLAAILYRYAQAKGQGFQGLWSFRLDFPDAGDVSDWATEAMSWMVMQGVINGMDGKLNPQGSATRVQVAAMVHRFCELIKK